MSSSASSRKTLLEPGHEAEWAEINRGKREYHHEQARALTPSERVAQGQKLSQQAVQLLPPRSAAAMSHPEPSGPDLDGVVASANAVGLPYVVIGGFSVIANGFVRATNDSDLLVPDGSAAARLRDRGCPRDRRRGRGGAG